MNIAYIALGSNIQQPVIQVQRALAILATLPSSQLINTSSLYQSKAEGYLDQPDFINCVISIATTLTPKALLVALLEIETQCGRMRTFKNAPRTLDLDILLYEDITLNTEELTLPHPRMIERAFVLIPLQEIAPHLVLNGFPIRYFCEKFTNSLGEKVNLYKLPETTQL